MEKVRPWCGQPSDRGRLRNGTPSKNLGPYSYALRPLEPCHFSEPHTVVDGLTPPPMSRFLCLKRCRGSMRLFKIERQVPSEKQRNSLQTLAYVFFCESITLNIHSLLFVDKSLQSYYTGNWRFPVSLKQDGSTSLATCHVQIPSKMITELSVRRSDHQETLEETLRAPVYHLAEGD